MFILSPIILFIVLPFVLMIVLGCLIFWVWMLVECAVYEPAEGNDKIVWILIIIFANIIGAFIYLLARRQQRIQEVGR